MLLLNTPEPGTSLLMGAALLAIATIRYLFHVSSFARNSARQAP
ncbi:MAG: PEP-CTERM sorting domain-containing protein [Acidobacteria bacterium]|nr:PEP-CTERM sorting domain-containing protein [Acidobacteriota bacterium]